MSRKPIIYLTLGLALFLFLGWVFTDILFYFIIAIVISATLKPLTNRINKTHIFNYQIPRSISVILSFFILFLVFTLFITLFIPVVSDQISVLSKINYEVVLNKASSPFQTIESFMIEYELTNREPGFLVNEMKGGVLNLIKQVNFANIINTIVSLAGSLFIGLLAVFFISFFLLYEMSSMRKKIISLIPNKYFEVTINAFIKIEDLFSKYLFGLFLQMTAIFSLAAIGLSITGIKYAMTIAVFAAVANLIPYLGPLLGATFGIIIGISSGLVSETPQAYAFLIAKIIAVFTLVQITDNILVQPLIFSKSVKAHPLEIFVIIFAGATLGKILTGSMIGGMLGMIAAIPVYTVLKVSVIEIYHGYKRYRVFRT